MTASITIPIREVGNEKWCSLEFMGIKTITVAAYKRRDVNEQHSFAGGHRVRLVRFWDNIHLKLPVGTELDIASVRPAETPPKRRHNKGR